MQTLHQVANQHLSGGVYYTVELVQLNHEYLNFLYTTAGATSDSPNRYWLRSIQRFSWDGSVWPMTRFDNPDPSARPNLLDAAPNVYFHRVTQIQDGRGSDIRVFYGQPHPCTGSYPFYYGYNAASSVAGQYYADNWYNCYPSWTVNDSGNVGYRRFNKYVVTAVDVIDNTGGSPATRTAYEYVQTSGTQHAGWRYNNDPLLIGATDRRTYSVWTGYPIVRTQTGKVTYAVVRLEHRDQLLTGNVQRNPVLHRPAW